MIGAILRASLDIKTGNLNAYNFICSTLAQIEKKNHTHTHTHKNNHFQQGEKKKI